MIKFEQEQLKIHVINNQKLAIFTFFDPRNRNQEVTKWHRIVHEFLNIGVNYVEIDYRSINHGGAMEVIIKNWINNIDYFIFLDNDAIILKQKNLETIYDKLRDGRTVFGGCQNSNHIHTNPTHPFVQPSTFCISAKLYQELGQPHLADYIKRSDTCEEVTWLCQERGYNVCMVYPSNYSELTDEEVKISGNPKKWALTDTLFYGLGTTYGDMFFHAGMQSLPRSAEIFINKCREILWGNKKIEAVLVCKNYGDYLELTLAENNKYFDNIVVVTDSEDTKTQEACSKYPNVNCWYFTEWNKNGAKFNKGGALNFGLSKLKYNDWVVILDSDIVIKENFRDRLTDKNKFYGSYRRFIPTLKDYQSNALEDFAVKFQAIEGSGCGFFQCFNMNNIYGKLRKQIMGNLYEDSYSAEQVDIDFLRIFCPLIEHDPNLVRMNIELWHLGDKPGLNNEGRSEKDIFFNS